VRSRLLRWIGVVFVGVVALVVIALAAAFAISESRLSRRYSVTVPKVTIPADAATVERGHHLVVAIAKCAECHGEDLRGVGAALTTTGSARFDTASAGTAARSSCPRTSSTS